MSNGKNNNKKSNDLIVDNEITNHIISELNDMHHTVNNYSYINDGLYDSEDDYNDYNDYNYSDNMNETDSYFDDPYKISSRSEREPDFDKLRKEQENLAKFDEIKGNILEKISQKDKNPKVFNLTKKVPNKTTQKRKDKLIMEKLQKQSKEYS